MKYQLWEALKEIKIWTLNDEGGEKVVLQNEEVLAQSKAMDGHAIQNVSKDEKMWLMAHLPNLYHIEPKFFLMSMNM